MDQAPPSSTASEPRSPWGMTRRLSAALLLCWFVITFLCIWFARELDQWHLLGWPISFYMAAQGMMLIYLAIVAIYMWRMQRIDQLAQREHSHGE